MDAARTIRALSACGAATAALQAEHMAIEDALNTLTEAIAAGANQHQLADILEIVIDSHAAHFRNEEEEFREVGYPHLDAHVRSHQAMLGKLHAARRVVSSSDIAAALDVCTLVNTFHNHVANLDRPAHEYILKHRIRLEGDAVRLKMHHRELRQVSQRDLY